MTETESRCDPIRPGELLFSEGDPCAGFYLIASARVRTYEASASGRERVLAVEGSGAPIGELPVFDGGSYPLGRQPSILRICCLFRERTFQSICLEQPEVALKVLQVIGIIQKLSFTTVRHRLISWLLRQARSGRPLHGARPVVALTAGYQELASQIGTVRGITVVTHNPARLQRSKASSVSGWEVTILDVADSKPI